MRTTLLIVISIGLLAAVASAQPSQPQLPGEKNSPYTFYYSGETGTEGGYGRGGGYGIVGAYGGGGYGMTSAPRTTQQLVDRWRASQDGAERDKIEQTLRDTLKTEFNARLAAHEREIKELEEKVRQLRARLNLRREKQDEIVDDRLRQILREAQGLGWGAEAGESESAFGMMGGGYGGYSRGQRKDDSDPLSPRTTPSAFQPVEERAPDAAQPSEDSALNEAEPSPSRN